MNPGDLIKQNHVLLRKFTRANVKRAANRLALAEHDNGSVRSESREDLGRETSEMSTPKLASAPDTANARADVEATVKAGPGSHPVTKEVTFRKGGRNQEETLREAPASDESHSYNSESEDRPHGLPTVTLDTGSGRDSPAKHGSLAPPENPYASDDILKAGQGRNVESHRTAPHTKLDHSSSPKDKGAAGHVTGQHKKLEVKNALVGLRRMSNIGMAKEKTTLVAMRA